MLSPTPHLSQHQHPKVLEPLEGDPAKQQCAKASHHPEAGFLCRILRHKTAPLFTVRVCNVIIWTAHELCIQKNTTSGHSFPNYQYHQTTIGSWTYSKLTFWNSWGRSHRKMSSNPWEVDAGIHPEVYPNIGPRWCRGLFEWNRGWWWRLLPEYPSIPMWVHLGPQWCGVFQAKSGSCEKILVRYCKQFLHMPCIQKCMPSSKRFSCLDSTLL